VTFALLGVEGIVVKSSSVILNPGQGTFLDLSLPTIMPAADTGTVDALPGQLQLRGVVKVESLNSFEPPDPCITSLEVFDSETGRTSALLSPQQLNR
jgi:hypothetical protein